MSQEAKASADGLLQQEHQDLMGGARTWARKTSGFGAGNGFICPKAPLENRTVEGTEMHRGTEAVWVDVH